MPVIEQTNRIGQGLGSGRPLIASFVYDASVDSKTEGEKTLRGDTIPAGAIVLHTILQVDTVPTSGGAAKIALSVQSAGDVQASKLLSEGPWSTTGPKSGAVTRGTAPVLTSAAKQIVAKIEAAALTAGKFRVFVEYIAAA